MWPAVLIIVGVTALLGAGVFPGMMPGLTLASLLCFPLSLPRTRRARRLLFAGVLLIGWTTCYLAPAPRFLLGRQRTVFFDRLSRLSISAPMAAPGGRETAAIAGRLSLNASGTARTVLLMLSFWALFWTAARLPPAGRRLLLTGTAGIGTAVVVTGWLGELIVPQGKTLLWMFPVTFGHPVGPFGSKNHYALFCILVAVSSFTLLVHALERDRFWRVRPLLWGAAFLLAAGGVLISGSRGGFLALLGAMGAAAGTFLRSRFRAALGAAIAVILVFLMIAFWPSKAGMERLNTLRKARQTESGMYRLQTWRDALRMWRDFPVAGIGMEAFRVVFPIYKSTPTRKTFFYAENEYVQELCEQGVVGFILFVIVVLLYLHALLPHGRTGPSGQAQDADLLLAGGVLAAVGIHSLFDFPLRTPLNAQTAAVLLGAALPGNDDRRSGEERPTGASLLQRIDVRIGGTWLAALLFCVWTWWWNVYTDTTDWITRGATEDIRVALRRAPTHWAAWYELGLRNFREALRARREFMRRKDRNTYLRYQRKLQAARTCIRTACEYNPTTYTVWWELGKLEIMAGRLDLAQEAFDRAVRLRPYLADEARTIMRHAIWPWDGMTR